MKIYLPQFKEGVVTKVSEEYNPSSLELEYVDLKYASPLKLDGTVEKGPDTVTFRGYLTSRIVRVCGRCLKEVTERLEIPFEFYYEIKGKVEIDTTEDLRETVLIDHPMAYICKSDCRGLCPGCGSDLNEGPCRCPVS